MAEKINWTLKVQVVGGPLVSEAGTLEPEAYDKIEVPVAAGATDKEVDVQPGGSGQVSFLLIKSSAYDEGITYKVNSASSTEEIPLDSLQVLLGKGGVQVLDAAPTKLFFSNATAEDMTVQILAGRDATP